MAKIEIHVSVTVGDWTLANYRGSVEHDGHTLEQVVTGLPAKDMLARAVSNVAEQLETSANKIAAIISGQDTRCPSMTTAAPVAITFSKLSRR